MVRSRRSLFACLFGSAVLLLSARCGDDSDSRNNEGGSSPRSLVVYFSVTGNTEAAAQAVAQTLGADIARIEIDDPAVITGDGLRGSQYQMLAGKNWPIKRVDVDLSRYDRVIIGGPLWYGAPAPVLDSFLRSADLSGKTAIVFLTMGSSSAPEGLQALSAKVAGRGATVTSSFALSASLGKAGIAARAAEIAQQLK
jgi:flavodoxin